MKETAGIPIGLLNTVYLRLDCANVPLTGTLYGTSHVQFDGHMALGADAALSTTTILDIDETLTTVDATQYGILAQLNLEPAGVLGASTHLVAMDMQAQWNSAIDGSVHASVQGIKGEGVSVALMGTAGVVNELVGVYGKASNLGIADTTNVIGGLFTVTNDDAIGAETGDIASAYSLIARAYTDKDTGVITDRYGLYVEDITGGGETTNQYGIYCPALVGGTTTNLFIRNISANSNFGSGDIDTTGTVTGINITSGADPGHTHTGASLSGIDISADTNLAVSSPIVLTDDTLSLDQSAVDHGTIGGLTDDDHAQYWIRTVARADSYLTTGHIAVGSNAAATATRIAWFRENSTAVDTSRYGVHADYYWLPSGALGSTSAHYGVMVDSVWDTDVDGSTYGYLYGTKSRAFIHYTSTGALLSAIGSYGVADNRGAGTVTTLIGVQGEIRNDDNDSGEETGDVTSAYSFLASGYTDKGTGVIATRYGLYIEDVAGGGLLTNQYGIYCPALTGASGDNLFIKNISADSDFGSGDIDTTGTITGTTIAGANTNWDAAYTHIGESGASHTYINQSVVSGASPTFGGANFTGIDISAGTNLAVTTPIVLTNDTLSFDAATAVLTKYLKLDSSNSPLTGNLGITKADPEMRLTDSGDSEYTRITRADTSGKAVRYNRTGTPGVAADALDLERTNVQYIDLGDTGDIDRMGTGDATWEWTMKAESWLNARPFSNGGTNATGGCSFGIHESSMQFYMTASSGAASQVIRTTGGAGNWTSTTFAAATVYHIAVTYDQSNGNCELFVDGVSKGTVALSSVVEIPPTAGTKAYIGYFTGATTNSYDGWVQNFRISDTIRYSSGFTPPATLHANDANTLALYWFDGDLTDQSANANTGSFVGSGSETYTTGTVSGSASFIEAIVWSSEDGLVAGEQGIQTFGDPDGRTILQGSTVFLKGTTLIDSKLAFTQTDGNEYIDSLADGYLDLAATTAIRLINPTLCQDKLYFTQTDGNEAIDSLADGYMDYLATTGHRFDSDVFLLGDNRQICFGASGATDSYITFDGSELDILSAGAVNFITGSSLEVDGVPGVTGTFSDQGGNTITVTKGLVTGLGV